MLISFSHPCEVIDWMVNVLSDLISGAVVDMLTDVMIDFGVDMFSGMGIIIMDNPENALVFADTLRVFVNAVGLETEDGPIAEYIYRCIMALQSYHDEMQPGCPSIKKYLGPITLCSNFVFY